MDQVHQEGVQVVNRKVVVEAAATSSAQLMYSCYCSVVAKAAWSNSPTMTTMLMMAGERPASEVEYPSTLAVIQDQT
jgi:hypothetical protein